MDRALSLHALASNIIILIKSLLTNMTTSHDVTKLHFITPYLETIKITFFLFLLVFELTLNNQFEQQIPNHETSQE